jgi:hypothetical protein
VPDECVIADLETTRIMAIITEKKQVFIFDSKKKRKRVIMFVS